MKTLFLRMLHWLQGKCTHPDYAVKADILEGRLCSMEGVQWCEVCGSFRFWSEHANSIHKTEWREPRPDWYTTKERKQYLADLKDTILKEGDR